MIMITKSNQAKIRPSTSPRWPVRAIALAAAITLGTYLLLPYLETLSPEPQADTSLRRIERADLSPPPPPPPPEPIFEEASSPVDTPKPQLELPKRVINPAPPSMNLEMALGNLQGDFAVEFGVRQTDLTQQVQKLIFEIGDLDQPPRPLARLSPIYPPRARMRRIEGDVLLEFVVDPDGTVRNVEVISSRPADTFTDAALRAVRRWKFSPGTKDGRAVTTRVRQKVSFTLQ